MDFSKMKFNPTIDLGNRKITEVYPLLGQSKYWKSEAFKKTVKGSSIDTDLLIRASLFICDENSPLSHIVDFEYVLEESCNLLSIPSRSQTRSEIEEVGEHFRKTCYVLFKALNNHTFELYWSMKVQFHYFTSEMRTPLIPDEKNSLSSLLNSRKSLSETTLELKKSMEEIGSSLFKNKGLQTLIIDVANEEEIGGFAEEFAEDGNF
jgi:hypothetical protein